MNVKFTIVFICFYLFTDEGLYEGDMVLDPDQLQEVAEGKFTFASTASKNKLWPNNEVPYSIDYALGKFSYLFKLFIFCFSQTALLTSHLHQASISRSTAQQYGGERELLYKRDKRISYSAEIKISIWSIK